VGTTLLFVWPHRRHELDPNSFKIFPLHGRLVGSHALVSRNRPVHTGFEVSISGTSVVFIDLSDPSVLRSHPLASHSRGFGVWPAFPLPLTCGPSHAVVE